jgi:hypothetical protein
MRSAAAAGIVDLGRPPHQISDRMPNKSKRHSVPPKLFALRDRFAVVAGPIESVSVEANDDPRKIDHVWIEVRAGEDGMLQIALNTRSCQSAEAGYDPRISVGVAATTWEELPEEGVWEAEPLDYRAIEVAHQINFALHDRRALEELLLRKAAEACFVRGWGEIYVRARVGIHQVHCRRASFAHPVDHQGRDGALEFYFNEEKRLELLLFKFAGQQ